VPVPLQEDEDEPILALGMLLQQIYADVCYDLRIDYTVAPPEPLLTDEKVTWVKQQLLAGL
jgi:hypothetical protein